VSPAFSRSRSPYNTDHAGRHDDHDTDASHAHVAKRRRKDDRHGDRGHGDGVADGSKRELEDHQSHSQGHSHDELERQHGLLDSSRTPAPLPSPSPDGSPDGDVGRGRDDDDVDPAYAVPSRGQTGERDEPHDGADDAAAADARSTRDEYDQNAMDGVEQEGDGQSTAMNSHHSQSQDLSVDRDDDDDDGVLVVDVVRGGKRRSYDRKPPRVELVVDESSTPRPLHLSPPRDSSNPAVYSPIADPDALDDVFMAPAASSSDSHLITSAGPSSSSAAAAAAATSTAPGALINGSSLMASLSPRTGSGGVASVSGVVPMDVTHADAVADGDQQHADQSDKAGWHAVTLAAAARDKEMFRMAQMTPPIGGPTY